MTDLIESEDELLDPQPAPGSGGGTRLAALARRLRTRTPLGGADGADGVDGVDGVSGTGGAAGADGAGDGSGADPERRRRVVQAGALALALVAGAGAAGVAVHRVDLHRSQSRIQDRMLLHLIGGGAALTYTGTGARSGLALPDSFDAPMATDLTIGVRNDGARPMEITGVRIRQPGVDVIDPAPEATVQPGESIALTSRIAVHCTAPDLPESPTGATVTVRTPAAKGKEAGAPTDIPLTFTGGATESAVANSHQAQSRVVGAYVTGNFYHLCASALAMMPSGVTATAPAAGAGPQNPVVRYTVHIAGARGAAQRVTKSASVLTLPGVAVETDLKDPLPIGASGVDIAVTDRITDCKAFGDYLAVHNGAGSAALWLTSVTPLSVEAVDPRFRTAQNPGAALGNLDTFEEDDDFTFREDLLGQLSAACPSL